MNEQLQEMLIEILAMTRTNRAILIEIQSNQDNAKARELTTVYQTMDDARMQALRHSLEPAQAYQTFTYDPINESRLKVFVHEMLDKRRIDRSEVSFKESIWVPGEFDLEIPTYIYDQFDRNEQALLEGFKTRHTRN